MEEHKNLASNLAASAASTGAPSTGVRRVAVPRLSAPAHFRRHPILANGVVLIGNTLVGSLFGFLFWFVAARTYTPAEVGVGAACISAMTLLATMGELGLGTALIRYLPTMGPRQLIFVQSALAAALVATMTLSAVFVLGTPIWSPALGELAKTRLYPALFLGAAAATVATQLVDDVFIAFQVTYFAFGRNLVAAFIRLIALFALGPILGIPGLLFATAAGAAVGLAVAALLFLPRTIPNSDLRLAFDWSLLWDKAGYTLGNHASRLVWNIPMLSYPLIVVALLNAEATAFFYTTWMIANALFIIPGAISLATFGKASNDVNLSHRAFWRVMQWTIVALIPITAVSSLLAPFVLRIFGESYATSSRGLFLCLALSAFPYTVNTFTLVYHRIHQTTTRVILISSLVTAACLVSSIVFAASSGLVGIGAGWLTGQTIGAAVGVQTWLRTSRSQGAG